MLLDHLLALTFAVGFPAVAIPLYARRRPSLEAGDSRARIREYLETIAWLAGMGIMTLTVWVAAARSPRLLGLVLPTSWPALASLGVAVLLSALLFLQVRGVRRDAATREAAQAALEAVREYLPRTAREARLFRSVAFSAGIGEEIFYRGFLLWYLPQFMPMIAALCVSSIFFGLAHAMHGLDAAIRSAFVGALLAGLYLLGGSLLAPMLLHTAIDLSSGETGMAANDSDFEKQI